MIKTNLALTAATVVKGLRLAVDPDASTKTVGRIQWQPFYDRYIDGLYASTVNTPSGFDDERHICYWQWTVEQPFLGLDSRYSIAVVHNCPIDIICSIAFDLQVSKPTQGVEIVDDSTDKTSIENG